MPSDFPDALKQYKKYKSMGGAFVLAKNGSSWDFQIHPKVMIARIKPIAREATGQIIAGKWIFDGGVTTFEITFKKGKLPLNDMVRRTIKNGLELGVQPVVKESDDIEDDDAKVDLTGETSETSTTPKVTGVDEADFAGLGALEAMLGKKKEIFDEGNTEETIARDKLAHETSKVSDVEGFDLAGLDVISHVEQQRTFTGSIRDISTSRLAWVQAEKSAEKLLKDLSAAILSDFPDETVTAKAVLGALDKVRGGELVDALDDLYNAKGKDDEDAILAAHSAAIDAVGAYNDTIERDPVLQHISKAPYDQGRSIIEALQVGLKGISGNLNAMVSHT